MSAASLALTAAAPPRPTSPQATPPPAAETGLEPGSGFLDLVDSRPAERPEPPSRREPTRARESEQASPPQRDDPPSDQQAAVSYPAPAPEPPRKSGGKSEEAPAARSADGQAKRAQTIGETSDNRTQGATPVTDAAKAGAEGSVAGADAHGGRAMAQAPTASLPSGPVPAAPNGVQAPPVSTRPQAQATGPAQPQTSEGTIALPADLLATAEALAQGEIPQVRVTSPTAETAAAAPTTATTAAQAEALPASAELTLSRATATDPLSSADIATAEAQATVEDQAVRAQAAGHSEGQTPATRLPGSDFALAALAYRLHAHQSPMFTAERALGALGLGGVGEAGNGLGLLGALGQDTLAQGGMGAGGGGPGFSFGDNPLAGFGELTGSDSGIGAADAGRFGQMLAGAAAASRPGAAGVPGPAQQISQHMQAAAAKGQDRLTLTLKPAELGGIDIALTVEQDGRVHASILVERPETLEMLRRDAQALERGLQNAGLKADQGSLEFNLRGDGNPQQGQREQPAHASSANSLIGPESPEWVTDPLADPAPWTPTPLPAHGRWTQGSVNLTV